MFLFTYLAALLATIYVVIGGALLATRHEPLERALACYLLTAALWIASNAAADVAYTEHFVVGFSGLAFIAIGLNLVCFLVIVDLLIDGRLPSYKRVTLYAAINLAPALFSFSSYGVQSVSFPVDAPTQIVPGALYLVGLLLILADFTYGFVRLRSAVKHEGDYTRRMQLVYVITGLLITVGGLLLFDVILPLLGELRLYTLGPLMSVFFVLGCGFAISRHKLLELKLVVAVLERKVAERTRELKQAEENNRQLVLDLSHSLQTPLIVLRSRLDRLQRTFVENTEIASMGAIIDGLSGTVTEMLDLASLDRALREESHGLFSLSSLLEEIVEEVEVIADSLPVSVVGDIAEDVEIYGNEKRIREAIMNIASNALKYGSSGENLEVRFVLTQTSEYAEVAIQDNGEGIPETDIPYLFERFYRGKNRKYGQPGAGLGLAIAKQVVDGHKGAIVVTSMPGRGTTFTLRLPNQKPDL